MCPTFIVKSEQGYYIIFLFTISFQNNLRSQSLKEYSKTNFHIV